MIPRVLITLSVALFPAAATAVTPERSQAVTIAARTGEVIGAAAACGVPEAELVELGRRVIGWARDTARDAAELKRAQRAHEVSVTRAAARVRQTGRGACDAALAALHALEREQR